MTDGELLEIVERLRGVGGDHLDVEAKRSETELPKSVRETLSAFSNTPGGGVVILGLDETRGFAIVGVRDPNKIQQDLASTCDQMEPPVRAQIRPHRVDERVLIVAEVPEIERSLKPCYYKGAGMMNGSFIRVADGDRRLTSYEIQLLVASRGQPRDDEIAVEGAEVSDLDAPRVQAFLQRIRQSSRNFADRPDAELLRSLKVLVPAGARDAPSLAGLLALGNHPQRFFPGLSAQFVVYPAEQVGAPGPHDERFLDNRRIEGGISTMLEDSLAVLGQHIARKTIVRGLRREDAWQYPATALREAVVNALVHRDLSSAARGTPVQIQLFPDRLLITNPGGLFGPVTLDRLGEAGVLAARNATLMRILEDAPGPGGGPVCENRGSGIGAMIHALRRAGLEPPRFEDRISTFQVTFPNASLLDDDTLGWLARLGARLSETQRLGLALLRHGHVLDNTEYRLATSLDSRDATRELGDLVDRGIIEQIGTRRWATYRLASKARRRRDRRAEIVSVLVRRGTLSRHEIAQELELTDTTIRPWLATLRNEGKIELTGPARSPTVRYRIAKRKRRSKTRRR